MKSVVVHNPSAKTTAFPKLAEYSGVQATCFVVLFTAPSIGTVVASDNENWKLGYTASNWVMNSFADFSGKVELSQ